MVGVNTICESLEAVPPNIINVVANTPTDVLIDRTTDGFKQWRYRYIQNLTGADLYYCIADTADAAASQNNYHGKLQDGLQLAIPTKRRVSVWSLAGGNVATLELFRSDF